MGNSASGGSSGVENLIPGQQDESVCAQCGDVCPKLTYTQRLIGFFSCTAFGYVLSILGTLTLFGGASPDNIRTFVILYMIGNIMALSSTLFLMGPGAQCVKMWDPVRRFTTAFYLIMLIAVFAVAVTGQNVLLVLALLIIEILAAAWYTLSWVPFARKVVIEFFKSTGLCKSCFWMHDTIAEACKKKETTESSGGSMFKDRESKGGNSMFGTSAKDRESKGGSMFGISGKDGSDTGRTTSTSGGTWWRTDSTA